MATRASKPADEPDRTDGTPSTDGAAAEVQRVMDEATERGLLGVEIDPTDNEAYTVSGVLAGMPTPETDERARAEARRASDGR